jgi:hypothetical protein
VTFGVALVRGLDGRPMIGVIFATMFGAGVGLTLIFLLEVFETWADDWRYPRQ